METLLRKLNLENKEKILNIGWNKNNLSINEINKAVEKSDCIIVAGTVEYIKRAHLEIEKLLDENTNITIIDCYDINECESEIKRILNEHEKVLNTSGEKDKEEYITTIKIAN